MSSQANKGSASPVTLDAEQSSQEQCLALLLPEKPRLRVRQRASADAVQLKTTSARAFVCASLAELGLCKCLSKLQACSLETSPIS